MRCKNEIRLVIPEYAKGRLPANEASTVARHLTECKECREFAESLRETFTMLDSVQYEALDDRVWPRFLVEVNQRIDKEEEKRTTVFPVMRWVSAFAMAAAILAVLVIGYQKLDLGVQNIVSESDVAALVQELDSAQIAALNSRLDERIDPTAINSGIIESSPTVFSLENTEGAAASLDEQLFEDIPREELVGAAAEYLAENEPVLAAPSLAGVWDDTYNTD